MFWFVPKVLAGFGPPALHKGTASLPVAGKAAERGKPQGKPKRLLQHLAGTMPILPSMALLAAAQSCSGTHRDGPHRDLGFWHRDELALLRSRSAAQGCPGQWDWGLCPVLRCHEVLGHLQPSPSPRALVFYSGGSGGNNSQQQIHPVLPARPNPTLPKVKKPPRTVQKPVARSLMRTLGAFANSSAIASETQRRQRWGKIHSHPRDLTKTCLSMPGCPWSRHGLETARVVGSQPLRAPNDGCLLYPSPKSWSICFK